MDCWENVVWRLSQETPPVVFIFVALISDAVCCCSTWMAWSFLSIPASLLLGPQCLLGSWSFLYLLLLRLIVLFLGQKKSCLDVKRNCCNHRHFISSVAMYWVFWVCQAPPGCYLCELCAVLIFQVRKLSPNLNQISQTPKASTLPPSLWKDLNWAGILTSFCFVPRFLLQVADMLLELCVTELEDVATDSQSGRLSSQPVVVESSHPYTDDTSSSGTVKIPGTQGWPQGGNGASLPVEQLHFCNCVSRSSCHCFIEKKLRNCFRITFPTFARKTTPPEIKHDKVNHAK